MKPIIYCIEKYEYFNPFRYSSENLDSVCFLVMLSCREGTVQLDYHLSELVKACKKHEPRLHLYLQNLLVNAEEFNKSETRLIKGLEQDGFDVSRLLYVYFDHDDLEHIANWTKQHGKNQRIRTVEEIQRSMSANDGMFDWGMLFGKQIELNRLVYEAMKGAALGYLPTLNLLETDLLRQFNTCLNNYALVIVETAITKWKRLEGTLPPLELKKGEADPTTLEGRRQFWLKCRKNYQKKECKENPIFCVEVVEFEEEWEYVGRNRVDVWFKVTCAEGEWHHHIPFDYLLVEAMLNFPDVYADALKSYENSGTPRPREPAVLRGLMRKGHDLTPVLASYVADNIYFLPALREEVRWTSYPGRDNMYVNTRRWRQEAGMNTDHVKKSQTINLMRYAMLEEAMAVVHQHLLELLMRGPKLLPDYLEHDFEFQYVDLINDINAPLKRAWELKRDFNSPAIAPVVP